MKPSIQGYVSAHSMVSAITWLFFTMGAIILVGVWYFVSTIDKQAEVEFEQRIQLAFDIETKHQIAILGEYTYWDQSYENIFLSHDRDWVESNSGQYLLDEFELDFSLAIKNGEQAIYLIKSADASRLSVENLMGNGGHTLIERSKSTLNQRNTVSGLIQSEDQVYFVVGGPTINEETEIARKETFLMLGKRIDQAYLDKLVTSYQLFGLTHTPGNTPQRYGIPVKTVDGSQAGYITWTPHLPSEKVLLPMIVTILLSLSIVILIVRKILMKEQKDRSSYEERLYLEATTDCLTKINNRRYFMDMGSKEFYLYQKQKRVFSLLMLDIDHFKTINDKYGHQIGDRVLVHITQLCCRYLRPSDIFGRLGGEEFGLILPDTNAEQAQEIASRIRLAIMDSAVDLKGQPIKVTISIGLATLQKHSAFETLMEEADRALYKAKHQGRNCVISHSN